MENIIREYIGKAVKDAGLMLPQNFSVEAPPNPSLGDYSTNVAMIIATKNNKKPHEISESIVKNLKKNKNIKSVDVAGPGFINLFVNREIYFKELKKILSKAEAYGRGENKKSKINVEYISANPTGPLHVGNSRGGPIGEAIANLFSFLGYEAVREFYVNDVGGQVDRFAESLFYWYAVQTDKKITFPEGGYPGKYIKEVSKKIQEKNKEKLEELKDKEDIVELFKKEGLYEILREIREDCELLGITFDKWTRESDYSFTGKSDKVVEKLEKKGATAKKEGALWFKNPQDPEFKDKESVLVRSDEKKSLTYFADDIAYHADKLDSGYSKVIDVWGANHHGHIPRLKSALKTLSKDEEKVMIILYQYVRLKNAGKIVSMGKRLGNFVTLRQVIESGVDPDAFKYFILAQNPNTPFDFDLKLAADTSEKNPVFYIKYAHARICSILKKAGKKTENVDNADLSLLSDTKEINLIKELIRFPGLIEEVSKNFQVQTIPHYAYKIANLFHEFYNDCQVISEDKSLTSARLALIISVKTVLKNTLEICDIEAPEKM